MNRDLGPDIVGAGRIGTLRARLAAKHAGVRSIAVADSDPDAAARTATLRCAVRCGDAWQRQPGSDRAF